ncbi:hypothetical protein AB5I41_06385 [Sphingomonas sp. MMS24-JH45]
MRLDLALQWAQPFGDEAAEVLDQRVEGFGIEGHGTSLLAIPALYAAAAMLASPAIPHFLTRID